MFAPSILNTHLDITVTLDSDVIAKGIFVSCSQCGIYFTDDVNKYQISGKCNRILLLQLQRTVYHLQLCSVSSMQLSKIRKGLLCMINCHLNEKNGQKGRKTAIQNTIVHTTHCLKAIENDSTIKQQQFMSVRCSQMSSGQTNPLLTNIPLMQKSGSWFLPEKCLKNTFGRVTFYVKVQVIDLHLYVTCHCSTGVFQTFCQ